MAHFDHAPQAAKLDNAATVSRNARYGLWLFAIYLVLYGGFVAISAFAPQWMEIQPVAGINLAILYGMGLIVAAFVLAMFYGWLCRWAVADGDAKGGPQR